MCFADEPIEVMQGVELDDMMTIIHYFEWQKENMVKSCCAVGRTNHYTKGSWSHFFRFAEDVERRGRLVAAVGRKNWMLTEYWWICTTHFLSREKREDPLSLDYVPSAFAHIKSPLKQKLVKDMERFERASSDKKREYRTQTGKQLLSHCYIWVKLAMIQNTVSHTLVLVLWLIWQL